MLLATVSVVPVMTRAPSAAEQSVPEELLFEVLMTPWLIADGVTVYQYKSQYYLPVIALSDGFEFYSESDLERGYVSGWSAREENSFSIDIQRKEYVVAGKKKELPDYGFIQGSEVDDLDIYVQLEILNEIWPVDMRINLSRLSIDVDAEEELTFQARLERGEARDLNALRQSVRDKEADILPKVSNPYKWLGKPVLDLQASYTFDAKERTINGINTISGTQQIAKTIADYSATYTYDDEHGVERPDNIRLRFERRVEGVNDTLGIAGLRSVQGGDINLRQRNLIDGGVPGAGITFSSFGGIGGSEFDRITVDGYGPAGWEIELYNNNQLLEFGEVAENGEYRFEDVALRFGNNQIRIIMFGPQGQVREIVENHDVSGAMLAPGDFRYSGGFVNADRKFILLDNEPRKTPRGIARTGFAAYGVNRHATVFASATQLPTIDGEVDKRYVSAGAELSLLNSFISVEAYNAIESGSALDIRFLTDLFGVKLNLRNSFFNRFESPDAGYGGDALRFEGEYQANTTFLLPVGSLGLRVNAKRLKKNNGFVSTVVDTQQSLSRGGLRVSNNTNTNIVNRVHASSSGRINATVRINEWQLRGGLNYGMFPDKELISTQAELRYKGSDLFSAGVNLRHNFLQSTSGGGVQLGYDFGKVLNTVDAAYEQGNGWKFTVRASSSLHPYGDDGEYVVASRNKRSASPVRARVFLDRDLDGQYDETVDEPIELVRLAAGGRRSKGETNSDGLLVFDLPSGVYNDITLEEVTLDDPYFRSSVSGYNIHPLKGSMPFLEFPVIETGSIDGTVYYDDGQPIPGLTLELVDSQMQVVDSVVTAGDGFYTFEFVAPGAYVVRADPSYGIDLPIEAITLSPDDLFVYGIDMELLEQEEENPSAALTSEPEIKKDGLAQDDSSLAAKGVDLPVPAFNEGDFSAFVRRVRIGEHPDKVRLVLDLSKAILYETKVMDGGKEIYVDMPNVAWDAIKHWRSRSSDILKGIAVEGGIESFKAFALRDGGTRLHIISRDILRIERDGVLGPHKGKGHRFYIDLVAR